jgi:Spy/CpxP family protein refolding chaperone
MGRFVTITGILGVVGLWLSPVVPTAAPLTQPAVTAHQQTSAPTQAPPTRQPSGPPASGTLGPSWDWWDDPVVKKDLKLTDDQVRKIRDLFEKREAEVKPVWDQLDREGARLDKMTRERVADDATYAVQVGKVHHLFAEVRKSRTVMIYRMYRELQPEQYKKLQEIMERRRSMGGRGSGPSGPR